MRLSAHFSLEEFTYSHTAEKEGIPNFPSILQIQNLTALCKQILELLRKQLGRPIHVSSGFRSVRLNQILKGAKASQHMKGEAADIVVPGLSTAQVFQILIESKLPFDQCIYEKRGTEEWIHISFKRNRQELLEAQVRKGQKTLYKEVPRATG